MITFFYSKNNVVVGVSLLIFVTFKKNTSGWLLLSSSLFFGQDASAEFFICIFDMKLFRVEGSYSNYFNT